MIKKLLSLALMSILASSLITLHPMADPLADQLVKLQGKLGSLKGKLGMLKGNLGELKKKLVDDDEKILKELVTEILSLNSSGGHLAEISISALVKKLNDLSNKDKEKFKLYLASCSDNAAITKKFNELNNATKNKINNALAPLVEKPLHEFLEQEIKTILNIQMKATGISYQICDETDFGSEPIEDAVEKKNIAAKQIAATQISKILDKFNKYTSQELSNAYKKVDANLKSKFNKIAKNIKLQMKKPKPKWYKVIIQEKAYTEPTPTTPKPITTITSANITCSLIAETVRGFISKLISNDKNNFNPHMENIFNNILEVDAIYESFDVMLLQKGKLKVDGKPVDTELDPKTDSERDKFLESITSFLAELEDKSRTATSNPKDIQFLNKIKNDNFIIQNDDIKNLIEVSYKDAVSFLASFDNGEIQNLIQEIIKPQSLLRKALCYAHALRAALRAKISPKAGSSDQTLNILRKNHEVLMKSIVFSQHEQRIFNNILIPEALFCDIDLIDFNQDFLKKCTAEEAEELLKKIKDLISKIEEYTNTEYNKQKNAHNAHDWVQPTTQAINTIKTDKEILQVIQTLRDMTKVNRPTHPRNTWITLRSARSALRVKSSVFYKERLKEGVDLNIEIPPVLDKDCWLKYINTLDINDINILHDNFDQKECWNRTFKIAKLKIQDALDSRLQILKNSFKNFNAFDLENNNDLKIIRLYPEEFKLLLENLNENKLTELAAHPLLKNNSIVKQEQESRNLRNDFIKQANLLIEALGFAIKNQSIDTITPLVNDNKTLLEQLIKEKNLANNFIAMYEKLDPSAQQPLALYYKKLFDDTNKRLPLGTFILPKTIPQFIGKTPDEAFAEALDKIDNASGTPFKIKDAIKNLLSSQIKYIKATDKDALKVILKKNLDSDAIQKLKTKINQAVNLTTVADYKNLDNALK